MKELKSTLARLQRFEDNMAFLSDVNNAEPVNMTVVNEDDSVDTESTQMLQELRELNSRREELLELLMA